MLPGTLEDIVKLGKTLPPTIQRDAAVFLPPNYPEEPSDEEEEEPVDKTNEIQRQQSYEEVSYYKHFNTRALPRQATTYCLEDFEKNALMILNHIHVEGYDLPRLGSNEDAAALERTFARFGFEIERHDDLPLVEVLMKLKAFSSRDFTDYGCVAVAVLTHGTNEGLLRANDLGQFYSEKNILEHFKIRSKPTLFTKPIVLIIQACRGTSNTRAVAVGTSWPISRDDNQKELDQYYLPLECDILVVNSSYAGKSSFRPADGSWFIQTLCNRINQLYKTHDLESIILDVKKEVAMEKYCTTYNTATDDTEVNKQMPVMTSTLIRKLHLFDKSEPHDLISMNAASADEKDGQSENICDCKNKINNKTIVVSEDNKLTFVSSWVKWSQSFPVRTIGICVGVCVMYNLVIRKK